MTFNLASIKNTVMNKAKNLVLDPINKNLERKFERALNLFLDEVSQHPVSQELRDWTTPSAFLQGSSTGSLFGFIGFQASYRPVDDLLDYLRNNIRFIPAKKLSISGATIITYTIPSKDDFSARFPLFWEGQNGWVNSIERGISGLGYFLSVRTASSRSTEGIQSQYLVNPGANFSGTPYLTPLFQRLEERMRE